jgi:hypothetical protein
MRTELNAIKIQFTNIEKRSGIRPGKLVTPARFDGDLIAFGEDDEYLHCVLQGSGALYQVYKLSGEEDHLYQHLLELNSMELHT